MLGIGLYGENGHQVQDIANTHPRTSIVATAAYTKEQPHAACASYDTLEELLGDTNVDVVSLCSPIRAQQAEDAIRCMEAGKHVYAEKPCALSERDLDSIIATRQRTGMCFHEMAGTAFAQPYAAMKDVIHAGTIGVVVQVDVQKSYPYFPGRPQDEAIDGGLLCQCAVHALRMIEHVVGCRIQTIAATETTLGNPQPRGNLRMAASLLMELDNGGVAAAQANYLNPAGTGIWGYERLHVYGTKGLVELLEGGQRTRLVVEETDCGSLPQDAPVTDYFSHMVHEILDNTPMPLTLEQELHPTRWAIRAKNKLDQQDA